MSASLGPFVTCFLTTLVLAIYVFFIIYVKKDILYAGMKFTFIVIVLMMARMLVPFNFPFTISIPSFNILSPISRLLFTHIAGANLRLVDVLILIWIFGAARRLFRMLRDNQEYRRFVSAFRVKNIAEYPLIQKVLEEYNLNSLPVCIVPQKVSPKIYGVWNSILVLPEEGLTQEEIYIVCCHELEHYKNHDLWLKLFVDLAVCIQWFNPLVYLLQNELVLAFEMSNDHKVLKECSKTQRLNYAMSIVKMARMQEDNKVKQRGLSFIKLHDFNIKRRIQFISSEEYGQTKRKMISIFLRYIIVSVMFVISLVFVPEAWKVDEIVKEDTVGFSDGEAYIVKTDSEYKLYINDEYVYSLSPIPEIFSSLPIIAEEDIK